MRSRRWTLVAFFLLTFAMSWLVWVPVMTASFGWPGWAFPPAGLVGAIMPGIAALIVAAIVGRWKEVRALLRQVTVWRVSIRWYAAALALVPVLIGVAYLGSSLWRGSFLPAPELSVGALVFMIAIQIPNTLSEELGWRGFALPRMAGAFGWLGASLILGVIWATWHIPYWISAPNVHQYGFAAVALFFVMPVSASVFLAWMYRETKSVLLTWLTHLSINVSIAFMPLSSEQIGNLWPQALYTVLIVVVGAIAARQLMRRSGAADSRRSEVAGRKGYHPA
ncbi:MAG TPA: CPBP family intramembrane glutamic endopeptidase [Candidatus Sulfotelmatobacter sp.]|nr:CPBP family intramembrane glutamic endopeptidase [Candidatus Sulfotelmatobacter sp.]